jgi:hypothetical protein
MKKQFGIYTVEDEYDKNGRWKGYRCAATASTGRQGKLYPKSDGREFYQEKPKDEDLDLEI